MSLVRRRRAGADLVGSEEIEVLPCVGWRVVCWPTQARRGVLLKRDGSQAKKSTLTLDKTTHKHFWSGRQVSKYLWLPQGEGGAGGVGGAFLPGEAVYGRTGVAAWIWHGKPPAVAMARSWPSSAATRFGMVTLKHTEDFGIAFPTVKQVLSSDLSPPP